MSRSILIVSQQQMYQVGNQVLAETVRAYLRSGFRVVLLMLDSEDPNLLDPVQVLSGYKDKISVYRFTPPLTGLKNAVRFLRQGRIDVGSRRPESTVSFSKGHPLLTPLSLSPYYIAAFYHGVKIMRTHDISVVCGFELVSAPVAKLLADTFSVPCVTAYQGTFLYRDIVAGRAFQRRPHEVIGTGIQADLIFMLNDGTRGDEVLHLLGVPDDRIRFRVSGVRKDLYDPTINADEFLSKYGVHPSRGHRTLFTLSKLTRWKRIDRVIAAMPAVLEQHPDTFLFILHRGPEREALEDYARELGVLEQVIFVGPIPHPEVKGFLNSCEVFLSVNEHSNLSNPLLEALECGRAIVTLDDGSSKGTLTHGENALLVPKEGIAAGLPDAINLILGNDVVLHHLAKNARCYAEQHLLGWEERMKLEADEVSRLVSK